MKNDMKLIMESWRSNSLLKEDKGKLTIGQFMDDMKEKVDPDDKIEKTYETEFEKAANAQEHTKSDIGNVLERVLKNFSKESFFQIFAASGGTVVTAGVGAMLGAPVTATLTAGGLAAIAITYALDTTLRHLTDKIGELKNSFDLRDPDSKKFETEAYWNISDDLVKIIKGLDQKYDDLEKSITADIYEDVVRAIKEVRNKINDLAETGDVDEYQAYMALPITKLFPRGTADQRARQKYSNALGIETSQTLPPARI